MKNENIYISPQIEMIELDAQSSLCMVTSGGTQELYDGGDTDLWF